MYEELVKRLRNIAKSDSNIKSNYVGLTMLQAADAIEKLINTIQDHDFLESLVKSDWIPVTERLPEIKEHHVSDSVLVYVDDGGMSFSELEENIFGQVWFDIERPSPDGESDFTVTHWMPLPEPPKAESEGE